MIFSTPWTLHLAGGEATTPNIDKLAKQGNNVPPITIPPLPVRHPELCYSLVTISFDRRSKFAIILPTPEQENEPGYEGILK
jgi:hypothetical protein